MKRKTFAIYFFVLIFISVVIIVFTRHEIISYFLQYAIESKSGNKITLNQKKLYMNLKTWQIVIYKPQLTFKNMYLSENDSLEIKKLSFDKLVINGMSFKQLLINKDFVCRKLMINKPLLELSGLSNSHSDSTYNPPFDPFLLIKIFKSRSFGKTDIYLNIDSTFINFGKVNILENKTQNGNGNAAYSLEITGLKTQKQNNINELTYNELNAGVGKFNYYFPSKNLHLFIDTAFYLSHKKLITIKNAQLNETRNSNSNTPLFHAGKMILQGVLLYNTDTLNLKKIYLKKFLLQNSTLIYKNTKNNNIKKGVFNLLFAVFPEINCDTLSLINIDLIIKNKNNRSAIKNIQLLSTNIHVDSTVLNNNYKHIAFDDFNFKFDNFSIINNNLNFSTNSGFFTEKNKTLILNDIIFNSGFHDTLSLTINTLVLDNLSLTSRLDLISKKEE